MADKKAYAIPFNRVASDFNPRDEDEYNLAWKCINDELRYINRSDIEVYPDSEPFEAAYQPFYPAHKSLEAAVERGIERFRSLTGRHA